MNRRDFLKSLFAVVGSSALPAIDLSAAPESAIDQVWETLQQEPALFYVRDYGTLTTDPCYDSCPRTRAEAYDINEPLDIDEVVSLAKDQPRVQWFIDDALYEANVDELRLLDEDQQHDLLFQVQLWVIGAPDEWDAEHITLSGQGGQGSALWYFRDEFEYCDDFNILIVEGDCPGSSYFAAELRMPVDEANELAKELGIPIRFAWLGF